MDNEQQLVEGIGQGEESSHNRLEESEEAAFQAEGESDNFVEPASDVALEAEDAWIGERSIDSMEGSGEERVGGMDAAEGGLSGATAGSAGFYPGAELGATVHLLEGGVEGDGRNDGNEVALDDVIVRIEDGETSLLEGHVEGVFAAGISTTNLLDDGTSDQGNGSEEASSFFRAETSSINLLEQANKGRIRTKRGSYGLTEEDEDEEASGEKPTFTLTAQPPEVSSTNLLDDDGEEAAMAGTEQGETSIDLLESAGAEVFPPEVSSTNLLDDDDDEEAAQAGAEQGGTSISLLEVADAEVFQPGVNSTNLLETDDEEAKSDGVSYIPSEPSDEASKHEVSMTNLLETDDEEGLQTRAAAFEVSSTNLLDEDGLQVRTAALEVSPTNLLDDGVSTATENVPAESLSIPFNTSSNVDPSAFSYDVDLNAASEPNAPALQTYFAASSGSEFDSLLTVQSPHLPPQMISSSQGTEKEATDRAGHQAGIGFSTHVEKELLPQGQLADIQVYEQQRSKSKPNEDFIYDLWIPSESTKKCLFQVMKVSPTFIPGPDQLTMPGVALVDSLDDPIRVIYQKNFGSQESRNRITVLETPSGLNALLERGHYRSALDLTAKLLTQRGQGRGMIGRLSRNTPDSLQIWFVRIALMMKLKLFTQAEVELEPFGNFDKPDLYYEYYQDDSLGRKGSMVPFGLRMLYAELPQYLSKAPVTLDRLHQLSRICIRILTNLEEKSFEDERLSNLTEEALKDCLSLWRKRKLKVLFSIVNCLVFLKDYDVAMENLAKMASMDGVDKDAVDAAIGRILLLAGDTERANKFFEKLHQSNQISESLYCLNKAFILIANEDYAGAVTSLERANALDPDNATIINNLAVATLYSGRLRDSIALIENYVKTNQEKGLHDGILFNLSTLYELESSKAQQKKLNILATIYQQKGDGFPFTCLKLST